MFIIILGCGKLGLQLTRAFHAIDYEVITIEHNKNIVQSLEDELGAHLIIGDGTDPKTLIEAGIQRADFFITTTNKDETNLVSCFFAKKTFQVGKTIAIINHPQHEAVFTTSGTDVLINAHRLIMGHIEEEVTDKPLIHVMNLDSRSSRLINITIPSDASVIGKELQEINMPPHSFPCLITKNKNSGIPDKNTIIERGDKLLLVTNSDEERTIFNIFTGTTQ